jgi:hypothetical protein
VEKAARITNEEQAEAKARMLDRIERLVDRLVFFGCGYAACAFSHWMNWL